MILPLFHHHPSFPPQTLIIQNPQSLSKTLISQNPKSHKFLLRCSTTVTDSAIQRIADKLRSLGYADENPKKTLEPSHGSAGEIFVPLPQQLPKLRVGHTIDPSWSLPANPVPEPGSGSVIARFHELSSEVEKEKRWVKKEVLEKVPTLAELSLPAEELRRLRGIGIKLKKKLKVGKAGITEGIVNGIHERWRRAEVVKIACEDLCKMNMKRTHDILERKTGGLVVWRSGSNIILYRGANYKYPYFLIDDKSSNDTSHEALPDNGGHGRNENYSSSMDGVKSSNLSPSNQIAQSSLIQGVGSPNRARFQLLGEAQLAEEADRLLDGLGPRFTDWWGYDPLPVDADLLPAVVPGYRRPFRLLPYGVNPKLTNDEMTTLRRLSRPLPCHFALGRNRNHQGLAASIVKLWEKCEIVKIAVKRGVQNTNSEMMAEEIKRLTGGTLLSRDREFIVFYRGKDFLPPAVSSAIEERRKYGIHGEKQEAVYITSKHASEDEVNGKNYQKRNLLSEQRKLRSTEAVIKRTSTNLSMEPELGTVECASKDELNGKNYQKRNLLLEQRKLKCTEAAIERTSTKLSMALEKKARAEKLLGELEKAEIPQQTETDKEGITEEERYMLRKVGLRMKPFLLLGRRGIFDGTVENMHLHWKYRELVKILSKEKSIQDVHGVARTLEAESGGILVAVERVNKGCVIIVYRGKNYKRPACIRPQTLLNKREAMKRSLEAQRRESLKLHVLKLTRNIDEMKIQLAKDTEANSEQSADESKHQSVKEIRGSDSASMDSNDGMNASVDSLEIIQQDKRIDLSSKHENENENDKAEPKSPSESVLKETKAFVNLKDGGDVDSSCSDNVMPQGHTSFSVIVNVNPHVSDNGPMVSSVEAAKNKLEMSVHKNGSNGVPFRASPLSNRDRLLLRKQALKMKKRPVLAVGRSNSVGGVAKTIKAHFQKYPLAIVNVKGRAKGTSVQELVFKLEQATGAVLVSQEPSKVILYRGWGAGEEPGHPGKKNTRDASETSAGKQGLVSPQLLAAIRLECGLLGNQPKEVTL